jgi:hypothetical protein
LERGLKGGTPVYDSSRTDERNGLRAGEGPYLGSKSGKVPTPAPRGE